MNPTYKIYGKERREIKKELSLLKSFVKSFWFYNDIDDGGVDIITANKIISDAKEKITTIEQKLSIKNNRQEKLERILNEKR